MFVYLLSPNNNSVMRHLIISFLNTCLESCNWRSFPRNYESICDLRLSEGSTNLKLMAREMSHLACDDCDNVAPSQLFDFL